MSDEDLRQWCVERAIASAACGVSVLDLAESYYQYVKTGPLTKEPVKQAA